ncbi:MAG: hypothetical protein WKG00_27520 [Polyangiaceae bacterium]
MNAKISSGRAAASTLLLATTVALGAACGGEEFTAVKAPEIYRCECKAEVGDVVTNFHDYVCAYEFTAGAQCAKKCDENDAASMIWKSEKIVCTDDMVDAWNTDPGAGGTGADGQGGAGGAGGGGGAGDPPRPGGTSEAEFEADTSYVAISHAGAQAVASASGILEFVGGCEAGSCELEISYAAIAVSAFSIADGGSPIQVSDVKLLSLARLTVEQRDGHFVIPAEQVELLVDGRLAGTRKATLLSLPPGQELFGYYQPSTGTFDLFGELQAAPDEGVFLDLSGFATTRPPVANAGPARTAVAGSSGVATVTLDGRGSHDLDDDLAQVHWYEGNTYLGSGSTLQKAFATGTHTVTARAVDATTRWSDARTTVSVLPR